MSGYNSVHTLKNDNSSICIFITNVVFGWCQCHRTMKDMHHPTPPY